MPTELDAAYMAGIIDGEGSMGVYYGVDNHNDNRKGKRYYQKHLAITNTDKRLIEYLSSVWGGSFRGYPNHGFRNSYIYHISWSSEADLLHILEATLPYLVLKRQHAELMIQWIKSRQSRESHKAGYTDEEIKIAQQMSNLPGNKKGRRKHDRAFAS